MIVCHGQAYNTVQPDGRREVRDASNPPLTPLGEAQAARAVKVVRAFDPQHVIISPFLRVAQTALAYLKPAAAEGRFDVRLSEFFIFDALESFNGVDARYYAELLGSALPVLNELTRRNIFPAMPESEEALKNRVAELSQEWLRKPDWDRLVFYGHGATVLGLIENLTPELTGRVPEPAHCSITQLVQTPSGAWAPSLLADVVHLAGLSENVTTSTGVAPR
ncbi:hypothetical protein CVS30_05510 [Arthrobacter psychrolactophilus]|uniref:Histidine phosphatase family protein n=2 Tax=Arthrobacter psychrolactophilus TaxID=92442 RepID=A0A2V5ISB3_9MICC|nr:hypothetical protein CVS30_05510 [Arthrobacter psychrolactophilus]